MGSKKLAEGLYTDDLSRIRTPDLSIGRVTSYPAAPLGTVETEKRMVEITETKQEP